MKKTILVATATLMMTTGVAFAEDNNTSFWSKVKTTSSSFVTDAKKKYEEFNATKILEKAKTSVVKTAENTKSATYEFKYRDVLNKLWDPGEKSVKNLSHDEIVNIVAGYETMFSSLVGMEDGKKRELQYAITHRILRIPLDKYTQDEVDKRKEEIKQK